METSFQKIFLNYNTNKAIKTKKPSYKMAFEFTLVNIYSLLVMLLFSLASIKRASFSVSVALLSNVSD